MLAVAELTLRKMREGPLFILLAIGVVVCVMADGATPVAEQVAAGSLMSFALGSQSLEVPPVTSGTACAMLLSLLLCVFWGTSEIPRDISSGLAMVQLSKPLGRVRYVLGKYLGLVTASLATFSLFECSLCVSHLLFGTGTSEYTWAAMVRQWMPPLMLVPLVAIALFASLLAGGMGGMIMTILYLGFSAVVSFVPVTLSLFPEGTFPGLNTLAVVTRFLFPNLLYFVQENVSGPWMISILLVYTAALTTIFLVFTLWRIHTMDINVGAA